MIRHEGGREARREARRDAHQKAAGPTQQTLVATLGSLSSPAPKACSRLAHDCSMSAASGDLVTHPPDGPGSAVLDLDCRVVHEGDEDLHPLCVCVCVCVCV